MQLIEWLKAPSDILLVMGDASFNLTHALAAIVDFVYGKVADIKGFSEQEMLSMVKQGFDSKSGDPVIRLKAKSSADFMFLDALGSLPVNEFRHEMLYAFINYRYGLRLPTVITTDLSSKEIYDDYGHRIWKMLVQGGGPVINLVDTDKYAAIGL